MAQSFVNPRPARKGVWFPVVLVVLLCLCVPGMVLLAMSLLGQETSVNARLQENFGLSYHVAVPPWAALLLLLTPFLIVLLYFLKMRRKPLQVPSTYLWKKSIEDLHVNSFFQWIRDNVLLLFQLLVVLFLIYAVMAFQVQGGPGTGKHYIVMIDNSASMGVADAGGRTRLEAAKEQALREIDAHGQGDVGMVIETNSHAYTRQPYTTDRDLLRLAVSKIQPTDRPTRLQEALDLADSLADPIRSTDNASVEPDNMDPTKSRTYVANEGIAAEVHIFSDGRFPDVDNFEARNLALNYHRVGALDSTDNVGIVAFNAVRDDKGSGKLQVFVRVLNFRAEPAETAVELRQRDWKGGVLQQVLDAEVKSITVPARTVHEGDPTKKEPPRVEPGEQSVTFDLSEVDEDSNRVLQAKLAGVHDQFPLDDEAWLVVGVVRKARLLIVTSDNDILHNFFDLDATRKAADVTYLAPDDLKSEDKYRRPARNGVFDLVVFDRCTPVDDNGQPDEKYLPLANTYFVGAVPPPWKWDDLPEAKDAQILSPISPHPLMRGLTGLDEIAFSDGRYFEADKDKHTPVPKKQRLLETANEKTVLAALPRGAFTDVVQTFPLVDAQKRWTSNWNLKLSFPLFLRNLLFTYGNVTDAAAEENLQPGEVKALRPAVPLKDGAPADAALTEILVHDPRGGPPKKVQRGSQNEFLFKDTEHPGVYLATWEGGQRGFAVNLLDPDESDIKPRDEVRVGDRALAAGTTRGEPSDLWPWAALAAFVLLLVEWALYHFRVFR
jgi:hypothetical protein